MAERGMNKTEMSLSVRKLSANIFPGRGKRRGGGRNRIALGGYCMLVSGDPNRRVYATTVHVRGRGLWQEENGGGDGGQRGKYAYRRHDPHEKYDTTT